MTGMSNSCILSIGTSIFITSRVMRGVGNRGLKAKRGSDVKRMYEHPGMNRKGQSPISYFEMNGQEKESSMRSITQKPGTGNPYPLGRYFPAKTTLVALACVLAQFLSLNTFGQVAPCEDYACDSLAVRTILDNNGLNSVGPPARC